MYVQDHGTLRRCVYYEYFCEPNIDVVVAAAAVPVSAPHHEPRLKRPHKQVEVLLFLIRQKLSITKLSYVLAILFDNFTHAQGGGAKSALHHITSLWVETRLKSHN